MGEMTGGKRERKGRDFYDPSLSLFPLYKGVLEDLGRDRTKMTSNHFSMKNCYPDIAKPGVCL
jgi:hypothetical protein